MNTWSSGRTQCRPCHSSVSLNETAATLAAYDQCNYLSHLNYKLVNEINDVQTQKYFYRNKLNYELRNHSSELEQAYRIINEKNTIIMEMQQEMDRIKKEFRTVEDQYLHVKNQCAADQQHFKKEMDNMERKCKQKVQKTEESLEKEYELKTNRRVDEVTRECEDRIKMYNNQIKQLSENSTQLAHQLKMMQDQHRDVLLKNDLLIQQSINRQLRKRDYQSQNNYLRDVSQYESMVKDKRQLKQQLQSMQQKLKLSNKKNNELESLVQALNTKYNILLQSFQNQRHQKNKLSSANYNLSSKYADTVQADTNTQQCFVPVVMPVDLDLMAEVVGLKEFVVEKIVDNFISFFNKTAVTDPKKKSLSLMTFKNSLQALKQTNPQNKILLYIQANLDRIIRIYCPAMTYTKEYMTLKDEFIKRTLMECEAIANPSQKLYRILQLINRIKNPITHVKSQISAGELRLVEIKFLAVLKKALSQ